MSAASARTVVTGGATGIGAAIVERLLHNGHGVASIDIRPHASRGERHITTELDVSVDDVDDALRTTSLALGGPIDAIFHTAGIMAAQGADVEAVTDEVWATVLLVNLTASFRVARAAAAHLHRPGGMLMLTSSQGGVLQPSGSVPYGASKAGIHGMVLTLEAQFASRGLRLVEFVPGKVDTALYRASVEEAVATSGRGELAAELLDGVVSAEAIAAVAVSLFDGPGRFLRNPVATM